MPHLYCALNVSLKELYFGLLAEDDLRLVPALGRSRGPRAVRHWAPDHDVRVNVLGCIPVSYLPNCVASFARAYRKMGARLTGFDRRVARRAA